MPSFLALADRRYRAKDKAATQTARLVERLGIEAPELPKLKGRDKDFDLRLVHMMEHHADLLEAVNVKLNELGVGQK